MNTVTKKELTQLVLVFFATTLAVGGFATYMSGIGIGLFVGIALGLICSLAFICSKD